MCAHHPNDAQHRSQLTGDAAAVPGHFYWVTTFIARFDPALDWPTDLKFDLVVDAALMAVDGARLEGKLTSQVWNRG